MAFHVACAKFTVTVPDASPKSKKIIATVPLIEFGYIRATYVHSFIYFASAAFIRLYNQYLGANSKD